VSPTPTKKFVWRDTSSSVPPNAFVHLVWLARLGRQSNGAVTTEVATAQYAMSQ
jgi:hypothetical protein